MIASRIHKSTGSGAVDIEIARPQQFYVSEVRLTLSEGCSDLGDFTVIVDSELGSDFDHLLATPDPDEDLTVVTSFRYADTAHPVLFPGDVLAIAWPNTDSVTWAVEVIGY